MSEREARNQLRQTLRSTRRRLFLRGAIRSATIAGVVLLAAGAAAVAIDQRWFSGGSSSSILIGLGCLWVAAVLVGGVLRTGSRRGAAHTLDEMAALKDRVLSAELFLSEGNLDEPRWVQVRDAIAHAKALNMKAIFEHRRSRTIMMMPVLTIVLVLSFFVPPHQTEQAEAAVDLTRGYKVDELRALQEAFEEHVAKDEDLVETLQQLREIERRLETGEIQEREVMLELSRLDDQLKSQMEQMDVAKIAREIQTMMPHLMANAAARPVGEALKNKKMDKAAEELDKLAEKIEKNELSKEEQGKLANNMSVAASKLGEKSEGSLASDLEGASKSLKSGDSKGFKSNSKSMGKKFQQAGKFDKLSAMRKQLAMSKAQMSQLKKCSSCNGGGCASCNGTGLGNGKGRGQGKEPGYGDGGGGKGGLKAGTKATGEPLGNGTRLADSYREMVQVSGMAGNGPVESEVEETDGQTAQSQLSAKELYSEYEAVAEQAIESEEIPLSHRFHVKRYFQSIRPEE
jgi:hypothetical protein